MFDDVGTQVKPTRPPTDPERADLHLADRKGHGDPDRAGRFPHGCGFWLAKAVFGMTAAISCTESAGLRSAQDR